ncbi:MAG: TVP38/TMEM64 family protein [Planctomycetota bacterium]
MASIQPEPSRDAVVESSSSGNRWVRLVIIVLALVGVYFLWRLASPILADALTPPHPWIQRPPNFNDFVALIDRLGPAGPIAFIIGYALATVAFLPGSVLTLGAGAVFGLADGVVYVFIGASLGAALSFLVARYLARSSIEKKIEGNVKFAAIDRAVGTQGLKIVSLLRLSPIFPFNLLNYSLGLTKVGFLHYNIASLAMLPGTFLYVYYGSIVKDVGELAGGGAAQGGWEGYVFKGVGLVATIAVTMVVTKTATRALKDATAESDGSGEVDGSETAQATA